MRVKHFIVFTALLLIASGCGFHQANHDRSSKGSQPQQNDHPSGFQVIKPKHVVIVIEENHSRSQIIGNKKAPYINRLAREGAYFSNYHAIEHPSQPNYLDLFSGSNQGVTNDSCPHTFSKPNLASELIANHLTFAGYSEDLPHKGYSGCTTDPWYKPWGATYARKHSPWVDFKNVPSRDNLPFSSFPSDFTKLPTVSFVIPNLDHDMHNGTIQAGDTWLQQNLGNYIKWAKKHHSLLILTWDENDGSKGNRIPTLFVGEMIRQGTYGNRVSHFNLLRTLEDIYGLPYLGKSAKVQPIHQIWKKPHHGEDK